MNAPELLESANRIIRILKEPVHAEVKHDLFKHDSESMLFEAINKISNTSDYDAYLKELTALVPAITAFFDNVLVMDEDVNVKNNRLSMLTILKEKFEKLCDFSRIQQ